MRSVALSGTGVRSFVDAQVEVLDFGSVEVDTAEVLELPLVNPSRAEASARITLEGTDVDQFGSSELGKELRVRPGEMLLVPISFRPLRLGAAQAVARVVRCPVCEPTLVQLIGNGVASMLEIAPSRVDFGRVSLGTRAEQRVTVRNNGNVPLTYRGSQVIKDSEGLFKLEAQPGIDTVLAPGAGFELLVSFTPKVTGMVNGPLLEVGLRADNTVGPGPKLPLLGEGGMACVLFQPHALDFGPVPEGMSTTKTAYAFNRCLDPVTLLDTAISAGNGGFFSLPQPQSGVVIAPGARVPVKVAFMPRPGSAASTGELRARSQQGTSTSTAGLPLSGSLGTFEPCQYRLDPVPLDFGRVQVGSVVSMGWILTNAGTTDCYLVGDEPRGGLGSGLHRAAGRGTGARARRAGLLPVSFQPTAAGPFVALGEAWVNHPTLGHPTATIEGEGVQACVAVEPASVDFGLVKRGCGVRERGVILHNRCTRARLARRGGARVPGHAGRSELSMSLVPALPAGLAPGGRANLTLAYEPADDGQDSAALRLTTDAAGELTVGVLAAGLARPIQTDRFVQEAEDKVDVLFVVDNSGSMMEEQQSLGQNFAAFLSAAQGQGVDYHIAVTTTGIESSPGGWSVCPGGAEGGEGGRLFPPDNSSPRIITPQTPNASSVFANNVRVGWCHWNEQGLEAAYRALSAPLVNSVRRHAHGAGPGRERGLPARGGAAGGRLPHRRGGLLAAEHGLLRDLLPGAEGQRRHHAEHLGHRRPREPLHLSHGVLQRHALPGAGPGHRRGDGEHLHPQLGDLPGEALHQRLRSQAPLPAERRAGGSRDGHGERQRRPGAHRLDLRRRGERHRLRRGLGAAPGGHGGGHLSARLLTWQPLRPRKGAARDAAVRARLPERSGSRGPRRDASLRRTTR